MPLDPRSVVDFLLERGLVDPADVLDGGLSVEEAHRRNANFAVRRRGRPGLFVKQSRSGDALSVASLRTEALVARVAAEDPAYARVGALAPPLRHFDAAQGVLVIDLVDDATELYRAAAGGTQLPAPVAAAVGTAVGTLHRDAPRTPSPGGPGPQQAWILSLPLLQDADLPRGAAVRELQRVSRGDPALSAGLAELRVAWAAAAFVHGDLKWENVLVTAGAGADAGAAPRVHLIDWELAGFGDAAWDLGGLLHAYLRAWVSSLPADALARGTAGAHTGPLSAMGPSVAALWAAYRAAAEPDAPEAFLERAVRHCGARLLQTAFEHAADNDVLTGHVVGLAQLAANVVARPREAASALLHLEAA